MLTNNDLLALKAELTNDPESLGLTTVPADDEANANKLNEVLETIQVYRQSLTTATLFNAIDPIEHQALSSQQARYLDSVLALGQIDPSRSANIIAGLDSMFSEQTASRPAYSALLTQSGNRITQMYQAGLVSTDQYLTPSDIANARNAV